MAEHETNRGSDYSLTEQVSGPEGEATLENKKADANTVGESAGGFLGGVTGLAMGSAGGPLGMLLGGLAGALGGWFAGGAVGSALSEKDDLAFRRHYESSPERLADRTYEDVRPAYVAGHLAARNPEWAGRRFEDVEADLRCGWDDRVVERCGEWPGVRSYARAAFERARSGG